MLKQRVITAIVLLAILLPALFYQTPVPFGVVALALMAAGADDAASAAAAAAPGAASAAAGAAPPAAPTQLLGAALLLRLRFILPPQLQTRPDAVPRVR